MKCELCPMTACVEVYRMDGRPQGVALCDACFDETQMEGFEWLEQSAPCLVCGAYGEHDEGCMFIT